jgi:hypothetical protein
MSIAVIRSKGGLYTSKFIATQPLLYFPLNESSGTAAINRGSLGTPANGTYTGVDLANTAGPKTPFLAPYFDGVNDYVNIMSAALDATYNGQLGTIACWYKMNDMSLWTDGVYHWFIRLDRAGAQNKIQLLKRDVNNMLYWNYYANGVDTSITDITHADTSWHFMAMTWNLAADQMRAYLDGAQIGGTITGLGTWQAGNLDHANIGVQYLTPTYPHKGWLAHAALWNRVLSPTELLALA